MIPQTEVADILTGVDVVESGDGPVVALAHGAGGGVRENFAALIDRSPREHRFVGPYYPGAGGTPPVAGPLDIEALADQVVAAGIRAGGTRFPVVGLSLGAAVAVTAAARHPENVSALVLTVGLAHADAQSDAFTAVWRTLAAHEEWDALGRYLVSTTLTPDLLGALTLDEYERAVAAVVDGYPAGGAAHAELAGRTDVTELLDGIEVPSLVVVSGQDRIIAPSTARAYARIRGAELIEYPDAGHIFTPDEAAVWAGEVARFLREPSSVR